MGFLSYGSGKALSYAHDFQKDIDRLYQREAYRAQVQAEKEKKSMFYASMMKEQTAAAPVNTRKLETLYEGLHKEIADFAINNPDWETDVSKTQQMMGMMDQFINNPIIREDQEVQQQWNATKEAYNNHDIREEEYEAMAEKYNKYKEGLESDPYVFANPKRKDLPQILSEINNYLAPVTAEVTDPVTGKITKTMKTPDENIHMAAVMGLRDRDTDFVVSKAYDGLDEKEKGLYKSKTDYFEHMIKYGEAMVTEDAGYDQMFLLNAKDRLDNSAKKNNYHRSYVSKVYLPLREKGEAPADVANLSFTEFGGNKQPIAIGRNGRNFKVYGKDENIGEINIKGSVVSSGAGKIRVIGGVPWVETIVHVSVEDDEAAVDNGGNISTRPISEEQKESLRRRRIKLDEANSVEKIMLSEKLSENGFKKVKVTNEGMMAGLGLDGSTVTSDLYVGTVLMPAEFNETSRVKYDNFYNTETKVAENSELYDESYNIAEVLQSGNTPVASSIINSNIREDIPKKLGRAYKDLGWEQDASDIMKWSASDYVEKKSERKSNEYIDFHYDFATGKTTFDRYEYED